MRALVLVLLAGCATAPEPRPAEAEQQPAPVEAKCPASPPKTGDDPKAVLGKKVEKVCLVGASEGTYLRLHETVAPREGAVLTVALVREDLEQLFELGMVRDASAVAEPFGEGRVVLSYFVTEYPFVKAVRFTGAKALTRSELEEVAPAGSRASPAELQRLKNAVAASYQAQGYSAVEVTSTGSEEVTLEIAEGPRTLVQGLRFTGAKQVSEAELRKTLKTTVGYPHRPDQVEVDIVMLQALYFDRGMVTVSIDAATAPLEKSAGALELTFTIKEGPVFRLGKLSLTGHALSGDKDLVKSFESRPRNVFSRAALKRDMERIRAWAEKQHVRVDVTPLTNLDVDKKTVDIAFELEKSPDAVIPPF